MQQTMSAFRPSALETLAFSDYGPSLAPVSLRRTTFAGGTMDPRHAVAKRMADIVLALAGLILMSIPMLLVAAAVRLTSRGPALFRQERIGLKGRRFVMLKFRTMHHIEIPPGPFPQATRGDPRVTRIGALLRRTSFDAAGSGRLHCDSYQLALEIGKPAVVDARAPHRRGQHHFH